VKQALFLFCVLVSAAVNAAEGSLADKQASYFVLTAKQSQPPPFQSVRVTYGPEEPSGTGQWFELTLRLRPEFDNLPMVQARILAGRDPLKGAPDAPGIKRYQIRIPETGETLEYTDRHTGKALLPGWSDFVRNFLPSPSSGTRMQDGVPQTAELLGHVLTLHHTRTNAPWEDWKDVRRLVLDPELLVGTSRNFRDREGHRLPQTPERRNYTYVPFTAEEYRVMIEAGVSLFTVAPAQEEFVRGEPVFYVRSAGGKPPLNYPADLYRANYLGPVMFMDEPSILMVGDTNVHRTLKYFSDAASLIELRTRVTYESAGSYGTWHLERALQEQGVNLGAMRLRQPDVPSWETLYDTTFYQMKGGGSGIVHEGRYQLGPFDRAVERFTGKPRGHTASELLQYHYAFLRGGTRPFGKFWGTAIYGQCDTNIAPLALTAAYDMGARYLWFWTSDHDHHVPWPEQMSLVRHLQAHVKAHARASIRAHVPGVDVCIAIPNGYFLSLENLWWVRVLDKEGKNEAAQRYRRLMQRVFAAAHNCFDQGRSFDITVDDGRVIRGYREVLRVSDE
jgi:hypothetical protein